MGEISIFSSVDADCKISAVLVLGNLHWYSFWCEPVVTFPPILYSFTCLQGTNLLVVSGSAAGWERDQGKKRDRLAFGLHICYCFILIVPSNSRLQAALCIWGSMTVQKILFSIWSIFPFIHSSALFFFSPESSPFILSLQRNITFLLFLLSYHLLIVEMGNTGNGNYYYFSHYIRILLCHSCWPYDQPFFEETLLGFTV